eukprot:4159009-Heterocapsa_arctica.AAC.1
MPCASEIVRESAASRPMMAPLRSVVAAHRDLRSLLRPARSLMSSSIEMRAALPSRSEGRAAPSRFSRM